MSELELGTAVWRKSSRSEPDGDDCVEIAQTEIAVGVRDSKDRTGPALRFGSGDWTAFVGAVKKGEFDLS